MALNSPRSSSLLGFGFMRVIIKSGHMNSRCVGLTEGKVRRKGRRVSIREPLSHVCCLWVVIAVWTIFMHAQWWNRAWLLHLRLNEPGPASNI